MIAVSSGSGAAVRDEHTNEWWWQDAEARIDDSGL